MRTLGELPEVMTALHLLGNGGPEMLVLRDDVPVPVLAEDEVLIRVRACAMNNTDVNTRVGWYSKMVTGATMTSGFDAEVGGDAVDMQLDLEDFDALGVGGLSKVTGRDAQRSLGLPSPKKWGGG